MASRLGRRVVIIVGSGGVLAAVLFLLGAVIYREWIPPSDGRFLWEAIKKAYEGYTFGFLLMVFGLVGILILHERLWMRFIAAKNDEIKRLVEQRNRLEDLVLKDRGSSHPPQSPQRRKRK